MTFKKKREHLFRHALSLCDDKTMTASNIRDWYMGELKFGIDGDFIVYCKGMFEDVIVVFNKAFDNGYTLP